MGGRVGTQVGGEGMEVRKIMEMAAAVLGTLTQSAYQVPPAGRRGKQ